MDEITGSVFFGVLVTCPKCNTVFDVVQEGFYIGLKNGDIDDFIYGRSNEPLFYKCFRCNNELKLIDLD